MENSAMGKRNPAQAVSRAGVRKSIPAGRSEEMFLLVDPDFIPMLVPVWHAARGWGVDPTWKAEARQLQMRFELRAERGAKANAEVLEFDRHDAALNSGSEVSL